MNIEEIRQEAAKIQWFHNFELVPGVMTGGPSGMDERAPYFEIPQDLSGKRVLDIGCADGYFTFLAEKRGATVVSIDAWPRRGFFFARELLNSTAEFHHMNIYDISPESLGIFDIVFFFGVYYHLKHPLLALERIASVTREFALIESESMVPYTSDSVALARFYELDELGGDPTNWWVPNIQCLLQTVRASGFPRVEFVNRYHTRRGIVRAYKGPRTTCKPLTEDFFIAIDTPRPNSIVQGNITLTGWAVSQLNPHDGIKSITAYLDHLDDPSSELGQAEYGIWRSDLTRPFGDTYGPSGFKLTGYTWRCVWASHIVCPSRGRPWMALSFYFNYDQIRI